MTFSLLNGWDMEKKGRHREQHKQRHGGRRWQGSDMTVWDVVTDDTNKAEWSRNGLILPVSGVGAFPGGSEEPC